MTDGQPASDQIAAWKAAAVAKVDAIAPELFEISDWMYRNPELGHQERGAVARLTAALERHGASVERQIAGMETAFRATFPGRVGEPVVAILAEYDALPEVGHGCGHNIIATAAIGAGIAVGSLMQELPGATIVLGCPAEESAVPDAGGKIPLIEHGYFEDVDAAIMIHPGTENYVPLESSLVAYGLEFEFIGKPAHAAGAPHDGINALDAVIQTFNGISALRQHLKPDVRVHGVITHGGGAPNVIPPYTAARFRVRSADPVYAREVVDKVVRCAEAGALAAGARLEWRQYIKPYQNMIPNQRVASLIERNMTELGLALNERVQEGAGSTDFGNVSHVVPAAQAIVRICGEECGWHSREVADSTITPAGHEAILHGARTLALTAIDLLCGPVELRTAREEHDINAGPVRARLREIAPVGA
ncbi:MAG TPA: M20 family metallopeptidase [Thermomicrobiales bacterium]|nr:M20 family metallopeptidase [Thermomicrobiales bacterium]